ncbi:ATP-dependent zinc metalloprotease FtsH [Kallipyga gabonensis]|uniref:ATP-dependent zinc metalloprotease FtsH n=1 Tax=Kallipyga gabonensis TaxID=1686287 RepID=UPI0006B65A34|nr:ATP-dependent zinc metalloprotease FtsH [Kallipyga gabonensis]
MKNNKNRKPSKITYYYIIVLAALILAQIFLVPGLRQKQVKEVPFSAFVEDLNKNRVTKVSLKENRYVFEAKDDKGNTQVYETGPWNDPSLTETLKEKGVEFGAIIPSTPNPILTFLITFLIPLAIFWFIGRQLMKNMTGSNAMSFGKSNAKVYVKAETGKSFADVAGQDEAKESLNEVVDFLDNSSKYEQIGALCPKGVLLVGPPGTGKTLLAQAVAGEADVPFFIISGSEFVELFVGMGASKVRDLFKEAKKKAPCIVFIDEIDAIGKRRDGRGLGGNDEREQTLNQLLSEMDGFDANTGVVILAATNRPEILDPALTRPGRFDRTVRVELPDVRGREDILKVHAKDVRMVEDVNFAQVARMTAGTSGADLANIINEGALRAVRQGRSKVTTEDLIESVETVIAGQQKKNAVITDRDKKIIAYHEVGHALVAAMQKLSAPVTKITIIPRTSGALGYTMQVDEEEKVLETQEDLAKRIQVLTGGRSAEELVFHTRTTGASNDILQATRLARAMVTRFGMTEEFGFLALETVTSPYLSSDTDLMAGPGTASEVDKMVQTIISQAHEEAYATLEKYERQLHDIAGYLLEKETITGEEFMDILNRSLEFYGMESLEEKKTEEENHDQRNE